MTSKDIYTELNAFMGRMRNGETREMVENLQAAIEYQAENSASTKKSTRKRLERNGLNSTTPTANALPARPGRSIPIFCSSRKPPGRRIL